MRKSLQIKTTNLITVICLLTLGLCLYQLIIVNPDYKLDIFEEDPGRNENSTPRTFVLPATPAVAKEQEKKKKLIDNYDEIVRCLFALQKVGFLEMNKLNSIFDVNITISLIRYQSENKLNISGEFDSDTKKRLECT